MKYVYLVYLEDDEFYGVFTNKDTAIIFCWNYYLRTIDFDQEATIEDWRNLTYTNEIPGVCHIDTQNIIESIESKMTIIYDLNDDK